MQRRRMTIVGTVGLIGLLLAGGCRRERSEARLPTGWIQAGGNPSDYEMGADPAGGRSGGTAGYIRGRGAHPSSFGTLMQTFDAREYQGKRLRLSGFVRTADVKDWAGLWMRVDGPRGGQPLAFDNMFRRPIKGTQDWTSHAVVLDVANDARAIAFGVLLQGAGQVWIDDLRFDVVGPEVPVTGESVAQTQPVNLDFEH